MMIIRRKPVLTHASTVCGMLAWVNDTSGSCYRRCNIGSVFLKDSCKFTHDVILTLRIFTSRPIGGYALFEQPTICDESNTPSREKYCLPYASEWCSINH